MGRPRKQEANRLPTYVHFEATNSTYYLRHPKLASRANLGKDREKAIATAQALLRRFRYEAEIEASRLVVNVDAPTVSELLPVFAHGYVESRRLKSSTAKLIDQRTHRIVASLGDVQVPMIDTQLLSEAITPFSPFEQTKMKTLLRSFFRYAKSNGLFPPHLPNPVDDLDVAVIQPKRRKRMTLTQFRAVYEYAPPWLQWTMVLALHLALRRADLVNLRYEDVIDDRLVARIRKSESDARSLDAMSVDFPMHPDVKRVLKRSRESALRLGRPPFVIHRQPSHRRARQQQGLEHACQILPRYASKAFSRARAAALAADPQRFGGVCKTELPGLHEIRSLSSHLYAKAGYETETVKDLMAHTDPDMTRHYQKGHERKVVRVEMALPFSLFEGPKDEPHE